MRIFAIGDLHLSHAVNKPMSIYGDEWTNHVERVKKNWMDNITPDDIVILPGDFSWALKKEELIPDLEWLHNLPGKKILIKGNHDLWWSSANKLNQLYEDMFFLQFSSYELDEYVICGSRGWICPGSNNFTEHDLKIYNRELIRMRLSLEEGKKKAGDRELIVAMHFPPTNDNTGDSGFTEIFEEYGVSKVIYGHLHGEDAYNNGLRGIKNGILYKLVSCDYLKCNPEII